MVYETVSVYLDGELIASVNQQQLSTDGAGFIPLTNYATAAEGARAAQRLAAILSSGELPMALENTRLEGISPLMGEGAGMMVSVAVLAALAVAHHRPHRPLPPAGARRRRWAWPCGRF